MAKVRLEDVRKGVSDISVSVVDIGAVRGIGSMWIDVWEGVSDITVCVVDIRAVRGIGSNL